MSTVSEASQGRHFSSVPIGLPPNTPNDPGECQFTSYKFFTPTGSRLYHFIHSNSRNITPSIHQGAHASTADIADGQNQIQRCSMTSHLPSQSSLLGVPRELRDLVLRYALPDVTFCVTECKWASRHDHSSNNNQEESEYQDAFKDMILDEPQDPRNYRAQRYIHLSVNSGGTPTPSPEGSNLHTAFALLSTNHQLRLESQSIFLQAPTSFLFDSTRGSPTFALANETLGILDSAELLKISHISVYGLHPSVSEDMPIGLPLPTRTRLLADYSCEQQALFVKLVGAMRLKTLFLEIYHDELSGLFSVIQVCRSWLETCWQLQGLSELKVQYTIPKDGVTDQYVRDLQDFVVELNQIPHVSAIIERRA